MSKSDLDVLIRRITPFHNAYRAPRMTVSDRILALWEIGHEMNSLGFNNPHATGSALQAYTKGVIKRPTIFRGYKVWRMWPRMDALERETGAFKSLTNLQELLPYLDPDQPIRSKLTTHEYQDLMAHAASDAPAAFKVYLALLAQKYGHGRLGKPLDKSKHLAGARPLARLLLELVAKLSKAVAQEDDAKISLLRNNISALEIRSFANICLSLTTSENYRLYKDLPPDQSESGLPEFKVLYDKLKELMAPNKERERARLRRVISAADLAEASDLIASIPSASLLDDYRARKAISLSLS